MRSYVRRSKLSHASPAKSGSDTILKLPCTIHQSANPTMAEAALRDLFDTSAQLANISYCYDQ